MTSVVAAEAVVGATAAAVAEVEAVARSGTAVIVVTGVSGRSTDRSFLPLPGTSRERIGFDLAGLSPVCPTVWSACLPLRKAADRLPDLGENQ